jgi:hypothetical protein
VKPRLWGLQLTGHEKSVVARMVGKHLRTVERWVTLSKKQAYRPSEREAEALDDYLNERYQFYWDAGPVGDYAKPVIFDTKSRTAALRVAAAAVIAATEGPGGNFPERYEALTEAVEVQVTYAQPTSWHVVILRAKLDGSPKDFEDVDRKRKHFNQGRFMRQMDETIEEYARPEARQFWAQQRGDGKYGL